jgi:Phage portal protein, SPP1 Gp6-like.
MKIGQFFKNMVNRMQENTGTFKKDVFELEGVPAFREFYTLFIFMWQAIYKGFYKPWHEVAVKTINDPKGKTRTLSTMNAGKLACSQMARYVWNEQCDITASMSGRDSAEPDPLNEFLQSVLKENRFGTAFGDLLEKSFALGGGALREWVEIPKDENGNDAGEGKIRLGYTMASQFVPTAWDNSKVTAGIFHQPRSAGRVLLHGGRVAQTGRQNLPRHERCLQNAYQRLRTAEHPWLVVSS